MSDVPDDRQREWEDRAVQELLSSPQNLEDLLRLADDDLAGRLDFGRMIPAKRRYHLPDLRKLESDLVVEVPFVHESRAVWIYVMLEHQSEPDRTMPLRLLGYMVQLWQAQVRRFKEDGTPDRDLFPILPVLFYTGERRWSAPLKLDTLMDLPEVLARFVPRFDTLLFSLRETLPDALTNSSLGYGLLALQQSDASPEVFIEALRTALGGLDKLSDANRAAWEAVLLFLHQMVAHYPQPREMQVLTRLAEEELTSDRRRAMEEIFMTGADVLMQRGEQRMLIRQANLKFGTLSETLRTRIDRLATMQQDKLVAAILFLPDLSALEAWLDDTESTVQLDDAQ